MSQADPLANVSTPHAARGERPEARGERRTTTRWQLKCRDGRTRMRLARRRRRPRLWLRTGLPLDREEVCEPDQPVAELFKPFGGLLHGNLIVLADTLVQ